MAMQTCEVCRPTFCTTHTVSVVRVPTQEVKFIMWGISEREKYRYRSIGIVMYDFFTIVLHRLYHQTFKRTFSMVIRVKSF
jgi:hypothetical protein